MIQNKQDVEANTNQDSILKWQNKTRYKCAKSWNQVTLCIVKKKRNNSIISLQIVHPSQLFLIKEWLHVSVRTDHLSAVIPYLKECIM